MKILKIFSTALIWILCLILYMLSYFFIKYKTNNLPAIIIVFSIIILLTLTRIIIIMLKNKSVENIINCIFPIIYSLSVFCIEFTNYIWLQILSIIIIWICIILKTKFALNRYSFVAFFDKNKKIILLIVSFSLPLIVMLYLMILRKTIYPLIEYIGIVNFIYWIVYFIIWIINKYE